MVIVGGGRGRRESFGAGQRTGSNMAGGRKEDEPHPRHLSRYVWRPYIMRWLLAMCLGVLAAGCGLDYVVEDRDTGAPSRLVVSGWTQNDCLSNLDDAAARHGVQVKLEQITMNATGGLWLTPPFWKHMYVCKGEVVEVLAPAEGAGRRRS